MVWKPASRSRFSTSPTVSQFWSRTGRASPSRCGQRQRQLPEAAVEVDDHPRPAVGERGDPAQQALDVPGVVDQVGEDDDVERLIQIVQTRGRRPEGSGDWGGARRPGAPSRPRSRSRRRPRAGGRRAGRRCRSRSPAPWSPAAPGSGRPAPGDGGRRRRGRSGAPSGGRPRPSARRAPAGRLSAAGSSRRVDSVSVMVSPRPSRARTGWPPRAPRRRRGRAARRSPGSGFSGSSPAGWSPVGR